MDTLKLMQSVWPSAWRANQLLRGSKVHALDMRASASPANSERNKRTAGHALEEGMSEDVRISSGHNMYRQPQNYSRTNNGGHQGFSLGLDLPPTETPAFFQGFDRWAPDNPIANYPSSLSTSVLPQQYSTGLIDDRSHRTQERTNNQRYPQYWSDYGALPQMDTAYGVHMVGDMVPQNPGPSRGNQQAVYGQDHQYTVFSESRPRMPLILVLPLTF